MKTILVVLGLFASTSLSVVQASSVYAHPSQRLSTQLTEESLTTVNYEGTNEDGDQEIVNPDNPGEKKK